MFLRNFEFRKAFKVAQKISEKKSSLSWIMDHVILVRQQYLKETGIDKEFDEIFKDKHAKKTHNEIKELKKQLKDEN